MDRFEKYIVIKIDDEENLLTLQERMQLATICNRLDRRREANDKPKRKFVCIHDGMKCYEKVWQLLEDEVDGNG